LIGPIVGFGFV